MNPAILKHIQDSKAAKIDPPKPEPEKPKLTDKLKAIWKKVKK